MPRLFGSFRAINLSINQVTPLVKTNILERQPFSDRQKELLIVILTIND
jgi:hypothetical protein